MPLSTNALYATSAASDYQRGTSRKVAPSGGWNYIILITNISTPSVPYLCLASTSPATFLLSFSDAHSHRMIPTEAYNSLLTPLDADSSSEGLDPVKQRLLDIVTRHGLADKFGVRLIHKHFDLNNGEIPVFRTIDVQGICTAIFMGPVRDNSLGPVFGKNFLLDPDGAIVPFEYTTSPCEAPSEYPGFVEEFAQELLVSNAGKVLGLCTHPKGPEPYTEFELPELRRVIPSRVYPDSYDTCSLSQEHYHDTRATHAH